MDPLVQSGIMHTLAILFGVGAWVAINGIWVELPVLISNPVKSLPEGWSLPSYLTVISQIGNIGPLVVTIMQRFYSTRYNQNLLIYSILTMGTIASFLLIFLWDNTAYISGVEHSIGFFSLFFILALVDCTSSVSYLPFMSRFQKIFLTTYLIGEGLSGFLPSIVALGQGASMSKCVNESMLNETTNETYYKIVTQYTSPRFGVDWFMGFIFIMMTCSSTSFVLLNHLRVARGFRRNAESSENSHTSTSTETSFSKYGSDYKQGIRTEENEENVKSTDRLTSRKESERLTQKQLAYIYITVLWITCISNGVMPSVISYTSLPYGQLSYHFAATLSAMANPLACFLTLFYSVQSLSVVGIFTFVGTGFAAYLMLLAVQSPCPVLVNSDIGSTLMILSQVIFVGAISYAKVSIAQILQVRGSRNSLVWYGAATQLGSMIGAFTMFPLVNVYYLFQNGDPCTTECF